MAKQLPMPTLLAAVVCDQAIQEVGTNKWTLVGTFNRVFAQTLPMVLNRITVYFCFSDAEGVYPFEIQLVALDGDDRVFGKVEGQVEARDRLGDCELVVNLHGVPFEKYGKYAFRLLLDGRLVGEKTFRVSQLVDQGPGSQSSNN